MSEGGVRSDGASSAGVALGEEDGGLGVASCDGDGDGDGGGSAWATFVNAPSAIAKAMAGERRAHRAVNLPTLDDVRGNRKQPNQQSKET